MLNNFYFWAFITIAISILCEHFFPRFPKQKTHKSKLLLQDSFWLILNLWLFWIIIAPLTGFISELASKLPVIHKINFLTDYSLFAQIILTLFIKDFLEFLIHNLLHRINFLWEFHKVHHSLKEMNWLGNTRFHPFESLFYETLKYLPLALLGTSYQAILIVGVFSYLIGNLNHTNCSFDYGPLRYLINSPAMHIWHHDVINHKAKGQNFGVVLSCWDFIFKTAYFPKEGTPKELGFKDDKDFPKSLSKRLTKPLQIK